MIKITDINKLETLLAENAISIRIDTDSHEKGDKILYVDLGRSPGRVNKEVLDDLETLFDVQKTEIHEDGGEFWANLYIDTGEEA